MDPHLIPYQSGFKENHSTVFQLLRKTEIIKQGWTEYNDTGAVFLDVAKAFDKVWIKGLIYKMKQLNIPDSLIKLTISYLDKRRYRVKIGSTLSAHS